MYAEASEGLVKNTEESLNQQTGPDGAQTILAPTQRSAEVC